MKQHFAELEDLGVERLVLEIAAVKPDELGGVLDGLSHLIR